MSLQKNIYAKVILPLKLRIDISYLVPEHLSPSIKRGCRVKVKFSGREYLAIVSSIDDNCGSYKGKVSEIIEIVDGFSALDEHFRFWEWLADYYMCTMGEVCRAASGNFPLVSVKASRVKKRVASVGGDFTLSMEQQRAKNEIEKSFKEQKPALLAGVTGSGKTEIYMSLSQEVVNKGGVVLYMVPEIALSRQLEERLGKVFGEKLVTFHSAMTPATRRDTAQRVADAGSGNGLLILGLRSSLFLPFSKLNLIIIDEEHDSSYKQSEPSPRYQGRDAAIVLAGIFKSNVLLGSATPSFESIYNSNSGRYRLVRLNERYHGAEHPEVEILDIIKERKAGRLKGLFSAIVLKEIENRLLLNEQVLIFRNRRSYSPMVQCEECGYIPLCSHCNTSLSYHKNKKELCCHYCDFHLPFNLVCSNCGKGSLTEKGSGTEMVAEKIAEIFPDAVVERFDAETTGKKSEEKRMLKDFASGKIDILVGTQMISKGFDFKGLSLVVIINADSMLAIDDFRANERAYQLLEQLSGRAGRGEKRGKIIVQSSLGSHPVYSSFQEGDKRLYDQLKERQEFGYPPFVRMIRLTVRGGDKLRVNEASNVLEQKLNLLKGAETSGPFIPVVDRIRGEFISHFWIKLPRSGNSLAKRWISTIAIEVEKKISGVTVVPDVDPQ
jgi:primosomal protein N' (replication factor Y)